MCNGYADAEFFNRRFRLRHEMMDELENLKKIMSPSEKMILGDIFPQHPNGLGHWDDD